MDTYDPQAIEAKWQRVWEDARAFYVDDPPPDAVPDDKFYQLEMLPYPSGNLHMGHVLNYTLGDVVTHFQRRHGKHVLRPMGWDSFGLPAENAAISEGGNPREITERNITNIVRQMHRLGWAIDWDRVIAAHDPAYYRWTQWLFLRFLEKGLAYRKEAPVNWCPNDQTVLANEQVVNGHCDRCGAEVEIRKMEQWFFRITAYADALLEDHKLIDWPERTKTIQRNWIGRSEGAELLFRIDELDIDVPVFTTRPDTVFGATFFVLAPEHPLVDQMVERSPNGEPSCASTPRRHWSKRVEERASAEEKTGVFTGFFATNPATEARIPVWVADYVLMEYGSGAIMAVPGHDERDRAFAERFELPVVEVVDEETQTLVESAQFSGLPVEEAKRAIVEWLGERGRGRPAVSFRLRDWGFSRQRYWGAPIPVVYCGECGIVPVPDDELPVLLPEVEDYRPKGKPPLASNEEWLNVSLPVLRRPRTARGRDDGHVRRLRLVLPALLRPAQRARAVLAPPGGFLGAGRPVHRRDRPRDGAPALLALLRQGAERAGDGRLPRAVPAAVPPGLGAPGRDEDVQVARQRDRARPAGRDVRRRRDPPLHPVRRARRPGHGLDRGRDRGHRPLPAPALADRARGRRGAGRRPTATPGRWCERRTRRSRG